MNEKMTQKFRINPPVSKAITEYDPRCFKLYLVLLDAEKSRAKWEDIYEQVFGHEVGTDFRISRAQYQSHLERARWMTINGYSHLLKRPYL